MANVTQLDHGTCCKPRRQHTLDLGPGCITCTIMHANSVHCQWEALQQHAQRLTMPARMSGCICPTTDNKDPLLSTGCLLSLLLNVQLYFVCYICTVHPPEPATLAHRQQTGLVAGPISWPSSKVYNTILQQVNEGSSNARYCTDTHYVVPTQTYK